MAFKFDGLPLDKLSQEAALYNSVLDGIRLSKGAAALAAQAPPRAFVCAHQSLCFARAGFANWDTMSNKLKQVGGLASCVMQPICVTN